MRKSDGKMTNQPSTPLDRAKTVHHIRWTDYTLRQFNDEKWRAATNDVNNSQDAARVTTATRPDSHPKTQQPSKPLSPPEPPPPQPRRPRPGTATENHERQRTTSYQQPDPTSSYSKRQPRQGARGGATPGDALDEQWKEQEQLVQYLHTIRIWTWQPQQQLGQQRPRKQQPQSPEQGELRQQRHR